MERANEYNAWYRNNNPQNARDGFKEYNRDFDERYQRPPEFPKRPDEYSHYPERYDYIKDQEKKEASEEKKKQDEEQQQKTRNASRKAQSVGRSAVQAVVGPVVGVVVGAVIIVASYREIQAKNAAANTPVVHTYTSSWVWSEDHLSATLTLVSEDGTITQEISLISTLKEDIAPTCTVDGYKLYEVTGDFEETTYSDTHKEVLPALGHAFDEGKLVTDEHGSHLEYTCANCGDKITIEVDSEETEDE